MQLGRTFFLPTLPFLRSGEQLLHLSVSPVALSLIALLGCCFCGASPCRCGEVPGQPPAPGAALSSISSGTGAVTGPTLVLRGCEGPRRGAVWPERQGARLGAHLPMCWFCDLGIAKLALLSGLGLLTQESVNSMCRSTLGLYGFPNATVKLSWLCSFVAFRCGHVSPPALLWFFRIAWLCIRLSLPIARGMRKVSWDSLLPRGVWKKQTSEEQLSLPGHTRVTVFYQRSFSVSVFLSFQFARIALFNLLGII